MTQEEIFKFLIKECGLTVEEYANLNDYQIGILLKPDRGANDPPPQG